MVLISDKNNAHAHTSIIIFRFAKNNEADIKQNPHNKD